MKYLLYVAALAGIFFLLSRVFPAIKIRSFTTAIGVALVYSVLNFLLGWFIGGVFKIISLPIFFIAWFFTGLVVNTVILWITDKFMDSFEIDSFSWTAITAGIVTVSGVVLNRLIF